MKMTRRREAFLDFYFGAAHLNAAEAARLSGFRHPRTAGMHLLRDLADVVEERMVALRSARIMSPDEVLQGITEISRDAQHKDRLRALELMARINGQLNDKLLLGVDRKQLVADLEAELVPMGSEPKAPLQLVERTAVAAPGPNPVRGR